MTTGIRFLSNCGRAPDRVHPKGARPCARCTTCDDEPSRCHLAESTARLRRRPDPAPAPGQEARHGGMGHAAVLQPE